MEDLVGALSFYRGKRVLVTGDTGFKGSWLCLWLAEAGAEVYGYALPPEREDDHFGVLNLSTRIVHEDGDIRNRDQLGAFFGRARPDVVFHLAAQALVRRSYRDPKATFDTNVGGSVNVLECVRSSSAPKALVYVTSDKCYRNREWVWGYRENDELGGHDPYSASKAAAELIFSAYGDSFFRTREDFGFASVRAGNVIGGGDWSEDRIVPDCLRALRAGRAVELRNPESTRPWQHVLEPLAGYLTLGTALAHNPKKFSGAWNFGPDAHSARSVHDLARGIVGAWGSGRVAIQPSSRNPQEASLLHLNCDKAYHALRWQPRWDFERTVKETVAWYRAVTSGENVAAVSAAQIRAYMESPHD
jgi:CDP-glucose 4,6-dehydratase